MVLAGTRRAPGADRGDVDLVDDVEPGADVARQQVGEARSEAGAHQQGHPAPASDGIETQQRADLVETVTHRDHRHLGVEGVTHRRQMTTRRGGHDQHIDGVPTEQPRHIDAAFGPGVGERSRAERGQRLIDA